VRKSLLAVFAALALQGCSGHRATCADYHADLNERLEQLEMERGHLGSDWTTYRDSLLNARFEATQEDSIIYQDSWPDIN